MKKFLKNAREEFFLLLVSVIPFIVLGTLFILIPYTRGSHLFWISWRIAGFLICVGIVAYIKSRTQFRVKWIENIIDIPLTGVTWFAVILLLIKVLVIIPFLFLCNYFRVTRKITHTLIWCLGITINFLLGIKIKYEGKISKEISIITPNHASSLDYFIIIALLGPMVTKVVAGSNLLKFPIFAFFLKLKCIFVDRSSRQSKLDSLRRSQACIEQKIPLAIFFEGGRKRRSEGGILRDPEKFEKGAFHLSVVSNIPIQPVAIFGAGDFKPPMKGEPLAKKWWKFQWYNSPTIIIVSYLPLIYPEGKTKEQLMDEVASVIETKLIELQNKTVS